MKIFRIERLRASKGWVGIYQQPYHLERGLELARVCGYSSEVYKEETLGVGEGASKIGNNIYEMAFMWHYVTGYNAPHWYTEQGFAQFCELREINGRKWDCISLLKAMCANDEYKTEEFRILECEISEIPSCVLYQDEMQIVFPIDYDLNYNIY